MQDANKGVKGWRFTLLRAFADYVDEDGAHRAAFAPGALNWSREVAVGSSSFLPWFERAIGSAKSLFGAVYFACQLDNSMVHIYSADFNPRYRRFRMGSYSGIHVGMWLRGGIGGRRRNGGPSQRLPARSGGERSGYVPHDGFRGARTGNF